MHLKVQKKFMLYETFPNIPCSGGTTFPKKQALGHTTFLAEYRQVFVKSFMEDSKLFMGNCKTQPDRHRPSTYVHWSLPSFLFCFANKHMLLLKKSV